MSDALSEATRLGLGEPVAISAETGDSQCRFASGPQHCIVLSRLVDIMQFLGFCLMGGLSRLMCPGEGLVDLYTAMQPILDKIIEERASKRAEDAPKKKSRPAGEDDMEGPQQMKIAIIGQPNVVKPC